MFRLDIFGFLVFPAYGGENEKRKRKYSIG